MRSRFTYASLASNELRVSANASALKPLLSPLLEASRTSEDALDTVMRLLLLRAARRRGEGSPGLGPSVTTILS